MEELFIIFNDIHIKTGNESEVLKATDFMVKYAVKNNIKTIVCAGDLFDSRSYQRLDVLDTFDKMIRLINKNKLKLIIIPGNHDKTIYQEKSSFIDIYRHHPGIKIIDDVEVLKISDLNITFIPFFSDEVLIPKLKESKGSDILISHFEMKGSSYLGRVSEKSTINKRMLSKWRKVFLGHYHDTHEISKDIIHLPSFMQNNFGEDSNKGFTVINKDLSYSIIKGVFKEFKKLSIDLNKVTSKELKKLLEQHRDSDKSIRFEFTGDESKLKSIDKQIFKECGIDVKVKYEKIFDIDVKEPKLIKKYDKDQVRNSFKDFCEEKELDYKKGNTLLEKFLKDKYGEKK